MIASFRNADDDADDDDFMFSSSMRESIELSHN